jgi:hypothetical protein
MKTSVNGKTKTYVELLYHSLLFSENEVEEVATRDPQAIAEKHKNAFGFRFFDQARTEVELDGKTQTVFGERRMESPWYYPGGVLYTLEQVKQLTPKKDYSILIGNMEMNNYPAVVKTRHGGFVHHNAGDVMLEEEGFDS